jgi:hypothetical protein
MLLILCGRSEVNIPKRRTLLPMIIHPGIKEISSRWIRMAWPQPWPDFDLKTPVARQKRAMPRWKIPKPQTHIAEIEIPNVEDEWRTGVVQVRDFYAYGLRDVQQFGPDVADASKTRLTYEARLGDGEIWLQSVFINHGAQLGGERGERTWFGGILGSDWIQVGLVVYALAMLRCECRWTLDLPECRCSCLGVLGLGWRSCRFGS